MLKDVNLHAYLFLYPSQSEGGGGVNHSKTHYELWYKTPATIKFFKILEANAISKEIKILESLIQELMRELSLVAQEEARPIDDSTRDSIG